MLFYVRLCKMLCILVVNHNLSTVVRVTVCANRKNTLNGYKECVRRNPSIQNPQTLNF